MTPAFECYGGDGADLGHVRRRPITSFVQFVNLLLLRCAVIGISREDFHRRSKEERQRLKSVEYVTPCAFRTTPSRRLAELATICHLVAIDIDDPSQALPFVNDPGLLERRLTGLSFFAYKTASSSEATPRIRIFVHAAGLPKFLYGEAVTHIAKRMGLPSVTKESLIYVQPMYLPAIFRGEDRRAHEPIFAYCLSGSPLGQSDFSSSVDNLDGGDDADGTALDHLRPPVENLTLGDVKKALDALDADMERDDWRNIAAGLRHQFPSEQESTAAFELFNAWSATGAKYKGRKDTLALWRSLRSHPKGRPPRTIRTLLDAAKKALSPATPPNIYYENKSDRYFAPDSVGNFRSYKEAHAKALLAPFETSTCSVADMLLQLRREKCIDLALNISGLPRGLHIINGNSVLVPIGPKRLVPEKGEWPLLRKLWTGMLGEEQFQWLCHWLASSLQSLYGGSWQPAQVIAFIGPTASGKSVTQKLFTVLLGGTEARAMQAMVGDTDFNEDWAEAAHLVVEDEFAENNKGIRDRVKENIKAVAVNEFHRIHPKGRKALLVRPFWRMTISCNPTVESLAVLPPLDDGVRNKISLLWTQRSEMPMPASNEAEKAAFWKALMSELPAFTFDMLNLTVVPERLRDPERRFAVRALHHPEALVQLDRLAPDGQLLQQILETLNEEGFDVYTGRAKQLYDMLATRWRHGGQTERSLGRHLMRFSESHPKRVRVLQHSDSHGHKYEITVSDLLA